MPRILFINNLGGGFADYLDIAQGTTVEQLFQCHVGDDPEDFLIRVNRQPIAKDQILQERDRVSITPVKIEGGGLMATVHPVLITQSLLLRVARDIHV